MGTRASGTSILRSRAGIVQIGLLVVAIAFVAWILATRYDDLATAFALTPRLFGLISASALVTFALNGVELRVLAGRFDSDVPFREAVLLGLMVSTLNYLPLKAGTLLNGVLMKARYKVSLAHFGALVAGSSVIHLWVALACAGAMLVFDGREVSLGWMLLVIPTLVVVALIWWGRRRKAESRSSHSSRIVRAAWKAVDGVGLIFGNGRLLAIEFAINLSLVLLASVRMLWSYQAVSVGVGFTDAVVVTSIGIFAARLSIIPGGIGFKEGGAAAGAALVGLDPTLGLAATVVDRAVGLVWLLALGVPATLYLQRLTSVGVRQAREIAQATGAAEELE